MRHLITVMTITIGLLGAASSASGALSPFRLSQADQRDIARVERYLNGLATLKAEFRQVGQRGDVARGTLYMSRPGKMRLEYASPTKDFIVSDGWFIFHWDAQLRQQTQQPLDNNLADIILREDLSLRDDVTVTDVARRNGDLEVTIIESEDPGNGQITLIFDNNPLRLKRWRVLDAHGLTTNVYLSDIQTGLPLERQLFVFRKPDEGRR